MQTSCKPHAPCGCPADPLLLLNVDQSFNKELFSVFKYPLTTTLVQVGDAMCFSHTRQLLSAVGRSQIE